MTTQIECGHYATFIDKMHNRRGMNITLSFEA